MRRRRGCGGSNRERFADEGSFFAVGTDFKIPAGELKQEVLPGWGGGCLFFLRFGVGWMVFICGFLLPEEGSGHFEFGFGIARSQEAIVADFDKARGQHMEEETADKLLGGERHPPVFSRRVIIPGFESHLAVSAAD